MIRSRAGFTNRLGRLKSKALEKMKILITNNEDFFFCFSPIFSVKTGHLRTCRPFCSSNQCDQIAYGVSLFKSDPDQKAAVLTFIQVLQY